MPLGRVKTFWGSGGDIRNCIDNRKGNRDGKFKELESEVLMFVLLARFLRLPVRGAVIQTKAESLRGKYGLNEESFKASRRIVAIVINRTGIGNSVRMKGEAGSVDKDAVKDKMIEICTSLRKYHPNRIFNQDETGFLHQLLPNLTYLAPHEKKKYARGDKICQRRQSNAIEN